ncbi:MAG TPA: hypothetical protein VFP88_00015 [Rhodanobacteraceae bacterium]|nr:hypothetical protein [Rhodanobacteraceae bacterium]
MGILLVFAQKDLRKKQQTPPVWRRFIHFIRDRMTGTRRRHDIFVAQG